uniref:Bromo domain-containing protein n=1 Tax=Bombyx mori TaxID=7091 RepID=A0A8R2M911_BOMMO|nr:PH-interacting protein isoform X4 [Bombyx mori]
MEESNEEYNVIPAFPISELYFLIAKFLSGGPLKETAKTLLKELETIEVLPRRLDWLGTEHTQSYEELASQHSDVQWRRLAAVCERALRLAGRGAADGRPPRDSVRARLSLLGEALVRPRPQLPCSAQDHSLVRRLMYRELGCGARAGVAGDASGKEAVFPRRLLSGLQLQRRTLGHLSAVYCLVFDCTGRYVITGADDLLVKVWSARDGRLVGTLRGCGAEITDVCVSRDGALVACGSVERLVRVWCLASAAPRAVLHAHQGTITSVHWSPCFRGGVRWLASTSTDGSVAFWTCSGEGQFLSRPVHFVERTRPGACHMICGAWSPGGALLAAGSADHHVRLYALEPSPRRILEVAVHSDAVDSIAWAHRGLRFVSGSKDGTAAVWSLHATQWRHAMLVPADHAGDGAAAAGDAKKLKVTMVCWDRSDRFVVTAVSDHTLRVWCERGRMLRVLRGHKDEAYVLEPHPRLPAVLLSAGHDGQLFVWDVENGEVLCNFQNTIAGQGEGAVFDAKWGGDCSVAASDSHGHVLLLGLGQGHPLLHELPHELFFHTDYRPLTRDALGGALDEQTETPPHLMPPPFLVDVEGAPHPARFQRLVPGRELLAPELLSPAGASPPGGAAPAPPGVWRGEGVRHAGGSWLADALQLPPSCRPIVPPLPSSVRQQIEETSCEVQEWELSWYRREMRRRPVMISTSAEGSARGPPRPRKRAPLVHAPRPAAQVWSASEAESASGSDSSDPSVRLSASSAPPSDSSSSHSGTRSDDSESSQYSDWETGAALAPPARARRRPLPAGRYRGGPSRSKRPPPPRSEEGEPRDRSPGTSAVGRLELPEEYRPGEWLTAVSPRKAPYHPQMGDQCLYFKLGHQKYFEAVSEKDVYKVNPRDKPWERTQIYDCELVKVVGVKYVIKPPRLVCLRLSCLEGARPRSFTVKYHDMADVIDFLVLRQQFDAAAARRWNAGDRFRCMIDDSWWTGVVLEGGVPAPGDLATEGAQAWGAAAAAHFLALRVRWDNGEVERLSPWDLEPVDPHRLPSEPGGAVSVLPHELEAVLYRAAPHEWPHADRTIACRAIARHVEQVMQLSAAEPFVAPVDLQQYPTYARVVPYPIDLATIRARFENLFYRRAAAAQFDVRYLASNAERFNDRHSAIVRQARLLTDLLLHVIENWREVHVLDKYHELAASYHSSDDEPLAVAKAGGWRRCCARVLRELLVSPDAEPFTRPVSLQQAPDYHAVVSEPMDLGTVQRGLEAGDYSSAEQFLSDVRLVFANSRLYNTNKRSRIYSMTVRLSALFEALWVRLGPRAPRTPRRAPRTRRPPRAPRTRNEHGERRGEGAASDSSSERDSWDSDAPLHKHRKGKGIGKKSKPPPPAAEPLPGTSSRLTDDEAYVPEQNGVASGSDSESVYSNIEVVEEELVEEDVHLTYDEGSDHLTRADGSGSRGSRKRRRISSDSDRSSRRRKRKEQHGKRVRERVVAASSSSSSWGSAEGEEGGAEGGHYESDRSYRPRFESDDDAPLHLYRRRAGGAGGEQPGTSRAQNGHARASGSGVSLRSRRSPRRYNEDSEDDSAAVISKRSQHHHRARTQSAAPHATDHDYYNGHASDHSGLAVGAVSVSSRGRVRKLTAKARGLLRE